MVPFGQRLARGDQSIRAAAGQPAQTVNIVYIQLNTVVYYTVAACIIYALAALGVQQLTGYIGMVDLSTVVVFQFNQTAFGAAIAEQFPLLGAHLL